MTVREMPGDYLDHLEAGGAPFGGRWDANIGEVVESYQQVVARLRRRADGPRYVPMPSTLTDRERDLRWEHHIVAVNHRPFDPAYALQRTCENTGATADEVRAVLREHGSITFGRADSVLLCDPPAPEVAGFGIELDGAA